MKHCLALFSLMLFAAALVVRAQGPDETYLVIYNLVQEGDALNANGDARQAAARYLKAQSLLKEYPTLYPGWNEKVVKYRLGYLATKLQALGASLPATNPPPALVTNIPSGPGPGLASTNQTKALQDEIARLIGQNALLEAKLKEALSVQPAAADPRELAKAEEKIQQLQKEVDLLKVSLEQEQAKAAQATKPADASTLEQERQLLADVKQKLAQQVEQNASLQKDNADLKLQIAQLKLQPAVAATLTNVPEELQIARVTIAALQATNIALRTDKILLETRLADLGKEGAASAPPKVKDLIKQRDELKKKLAVANRELSRLKTRSSSWSADDTARQLESVLARLDVYEVKAAPYSPEELALFKQGDTNISLAVPNAEKKTVREFPPGAGPLIADAQRASQGGRYADAEKLYLQVLNQDDKHVFTLNSLAAVQMEQNRFEEAEQTIRKALVVDPRDPVSLYFLGRLKYQQGKYDEAFESLSLSAKTLPTEARTQFFLGQTLVQKGQRAAAEAAFRKALQLKPGYSDAHHALALVYATQQPPFKELAQWHYNKAREFGWPRDPDLEKLLEEKQASTAGK